jgi:RNA 2',3'-cyclic 3'-phosphodiesterase
MARLFIGLELDAAVRTAAASASEALRRRLGRDVDARWIPPENLHVTLWFIGEVDDLRAGRIIEAVDTPFETAAFDLAIRGAGAFPPSGAPRVFWLGVGNGTESVSRLHREVAARLTPLGFEPEPRPYSAHLTIARVKEARRSGGHAALRSVLRESEYDAGSCRIHAVTVFRSHLSPKGAAYEALLRVPLR